MICEKCNNKGVLNTVLDQSFYYCRTCKEEIQLQEEHSLRLNEYKDLDTQIIEHFKLINSIDSELSPTDEQIDFEYWYGTGGTQHD